MIPWNEVRFGTFGGTLCSVWINLDLGDLVHTAVLSALGAAVSYGVSCLLAVLKNRKNGR
jgi:hypothetical protein